MLPGASPPVVSTLHGRPLETRFVVPRGWHSQRSWLRAGRLPLIVFLFSVYSFHSPNLRVLTPRHSPTEVCSCSCTDASHPHADATPGCPGSVKWNSW